MQPRLSRSDLTSTTGRIAAPPPDGAAITICALLLVFAAHLWTGANRDFLDLALSSLFLFLAGVAVLALGTPRVAPGLDLAAAAFAGVLAVGVLQLAPAPASVAHPFWEWTPRASAVTLDKDATWREMIKLAGLAAAFSLGLQVGRHDGRRRFFFHALLVFIVVFGLWTLIAFAALWISGLAGRADGGGQPASSLRVHVAAASFGMFAILSAAALRRALRDPPPPPDGKRRLEQRLALPAAALLLSVAGLLLTGTRAGVLSFIAAGAVFAGFEMRAGWKSKGVAFATRVVQLTIGLVLVAAVAILFGSLFAARQGGGPGDELLFLTAHWRAFAAAPWLGNGLGAFQAINEVQMTADTWPVLMRQAESPNAVLEWLEEAGLLGAALMFSVIAVVLLMIWKGLSARRRARVWLRAILCASLGTLILSMFEYGLESGSVAIQWALFLGVGAGIATADRTLGEA